MNPLAFGDRANILVLGSDREHLHQLHAALAPDYALHLFTGARALLRHVREGHPVDLVMLETQMPQPSGQQLCGQLRRLPQMEEVPVVLTAPQHSPDAEAQGLAQGAADFLVRPFSAPVLRGRVARHVRQGRALRLALGHAAQLERRVAAGRAELSRRSTALRRASDEVARAQDASIVALSALAETRDHETGRHVLRTQRYVRELAGRLRQAGPHQRAIGAADVDMLARSAALHDIGKVAIPDRILLKPGRLDPPEFEIMKTHALHGRRAIEQAELQIGDDCSFLRMAREIAFGHHEHWSGRGYPQGLAGAAIPLPARLMAVADVYDALTSRRVYKPAQPHPLAAQIIRGQRGLQFDPEMVDAFDAAADRFAEIAREFADP